VGALPEALRAPGPVAGMAEVTVALDRSWRFDQVRGIGALAAAINAGDAEAALAILADPAVPEVTLLAPGADPVAALGPLLDRLALSPEHAADPAAALACMEAMRVLCAHRDGPSGLRVVNAGIERWLAARGHLRLDGRFYAGRPVMVVQNDYVLGLFNGDTGITLDGPEGRRVWFSGAGAPRAFGPARLPGHETVFATTVHKAQGSEFDHVVVVLPPQVSPLVSRELLYTAVTRARQRVTLVADPAVFRAGVAARVVRASGLRARLGD
jgi:exodeoxyribonuclease V alpha subunit